MKFVKAMRDNKLSGLSLFNFMPLNYMHFNRNERNLQFWNETLKYVHNAYSIVSGRVNEAQ